MNRKFKKTFSSSTKVQKRFALRKSTVGVGSILVGTSLFFLGTNVASAAEAETPAQNETEVDTHNSQNNEKTNIDASTEDVAHDNEAVDTTTEVQEPASASAVGGKTAQPAVVDAPKVEAEKPAKEEKPKAEVPVTPKDVPAAPTDAKPAPKEDKAAPAVPADKEAPKAEPTPKVEPKTEPKAEPKPEPKTDAPKQDPKADEAKAVDSQVQATKTTKSKQIVSPNAGVNFDLAVDLAIKGPVKALDHFTVKLPKVTRLFRDAVTENPKHPHNQLDLLAENKTVIARGQYDLKLNQLVYTFNEHVNQRDNILATTIIPQFINRETARVSGDYDLDYTFGKQKVKDSVEVNYGKVAGKDAMGSTMSNISTNITKIDPVESTDHKFQQIVYVNPRAQQLHDVGVTVLGHIPNQKSPIKIDSQAKINAKDTTVQIFKVKKGQMLNPSFAVNEQELEDVTSKYNVQYDQANNRFYVSMKSIDSAFVFKVTSTYEPAKDKDSVLATRAVMENYNVRGNKIDEYVFDDIKTVTKLEEAVAVKENGVQLGDRVWSDDNANGVQDVNEKGLPYVRVLLKNTATNEELEAITDDNGHYSFDNLKKGSYTLKFVTPPGYTPSPALQGKDRTVDSNGVMVPVSVNGKSDITIDSGFVNDSGEWYEIGDYVWVDSNGNGVQDKNERGLANAEVQLIDQRTKAVISTTQTDHKGHYAFKVRNGKYDVLFVTPKGYKPSPHAVGNDRGKDSNDGRTGVNVYGSNVYHIDRGFILEKKK